MNLTQSKNYEDDSLQTANRQIVKRHTRKGEFQISFGKCSNVISIISRKLG